MSTKRLSKTVIEGGRANKWERRQSHTDERAAAKAYCHRACLDPEFAEEKFEPAIKPVYKDFRDKLNPMYRWLDAQIGRPWNEVRAEVFQKFDTRTTAGRHITFDHLLREVVDTNSGFDQHGRIVDPNIPKVSNGRPFWSVPDYFVDQDGLLRGREDRHIRYSWRWEQVNRQEYLDAEVWLNNRIIGVKEGKLYWFTPNEGIWLATWNAHADNGQVSNRPAFYHTGRLQYYVLDNGPFRLNDYVSAYGNITFMSHGDHWELVETPFSFRQRAELTPDEVKHFHSLKMRLQQEILAFGKGR